jgi:hypothetical protein
VRVTVVFGQMIGDLVIHHAAKPRPKALPFFELADVLADAVGEKGVGSLI